MRKIFLLIFFSVSFLLIENFLSNNSKIDSAIFTYFVVDPAKDEIRFFLKNRNGDFYKTFENLSNELKNKNQTLAFATNGGMFMKNFLPLGLYIENGKTITKINKKHGNTNFYIEPNGIFYVTYKNKAAIVKTKDFISSNKIKYATQSGPMLLIDGNINPQFKKHSINLNIRSGVGILQDGKILFAITNIPMNFFDFTSFFRDRECTNALFLDGGISEFYFPEKGITKNYQQFSVIIGVTK